MNQFLEPWKEPTEIEIIPTDVFIHPDYDQDDSYARGDLGFVSDYKFCFWHVKGIKQSQALLFTPKDLSEWATLAIPNGLFYIELS